MEFKEDELIESFRGGLSGGRSGGGFSGGLVVGRFGGRQFGGRGFGRGGFGGRPIGLGLDDNSTIRNTDYKLGGNRYNYYRNGGYYGWDYPLLKNNEIDDTVLTSSESKENFKSNSCNKKENLCIYIIAIVLLLFIITRL
jgi:hypothetical protein